jgi:signal transduction histidine kinase
LQQLATEVEDVFGVSCQLRCESPVLIDDVSLATHLYHISQEAVSNAIKHGKAGRITIMLAASDGRGTLTIQDDGSGCKKIPATSKGMGHHIMGHRSKMIGGALDIQPRLPYGTVVTCTFPVRSKS